MAFILVQHLDPTHDSMLVDLLASHTDDGAARRRTAWSLAPDHLYVIPPGAYLAVSGRVLQLSRRRAPWRSLTVRFPAPLACRRRAGIRRLHCPVRHRCRRQRGSSFEGRRRPRHCAGPRRSRLRWHAPQRHPERRRQPDAEDCRHAAALATFRDRKRASNADCGPAGSPAGFRMLTMVSPGIIDLCGHGHPTTSRSTRKER